MGFELRTAHGERIRQEQLGIEMLVGAAAGRSAGIAQTVDSLSQKRADREIASHSP
jgi:hypothetical protein